METDRGFPIDLQRQNEQLEEFATVVSHDLRNPLNVVMGHLDLAQHECDNDHLDTAVSSLDRMERIIDDILTLAQEGQSVEETEAVALSKIAETCWENVETSTAELRITGDLTFDAEPHRLQHIFENLFRNAVEHGGDNVTVEVGPIDTGFFVEDDGSGLPVDQQDTIFESGYSTSEDGTGFGLDIVTQMVDAHEWKISVTDGDDGGARFEVTGVEGTC